MPSEIQSFATLPGKQGKMSGLPGTWQASMIAALSALLIGFWARQGISDAPQLEDRGSVSRVAEVAPQDLPAALDTVSGTPRQLAQFRERDACSRRLAWVTVVRAPGQTPGRIRLKSGGYISPTFDLLDTPTRIAIPYPAPYATGHGAISVMGATADAVVVLTPPWHVPAHAGAAVREVSWTPSGVCPGAGK